MLNLSLPQVSIRQNQALWNGENCTLEVSVPGMDLFADLEVRGSYGDGPGDVTFYGLLFQPRIQDMLGFRSVVFQDEKRGTCERLEGVWYWQNEFLSPLSHGATAAEDWEKFFAEEPCSNCGGMCCHTGTQSECPADLIPGWTPV